MVRHCQRMPLRESRELRGCLFRAVQRLRGVTTLGGVGDKLFHDCWPLRGCDGKCGERQTSKVSVWKDGAVGVGGVGGRGDLLVRNDGGGCGPIES